MMTREAIATSVAEELLQALKTRRIRRIGVDLIQSALWRRDDCPLGDASFEDLQNLTVRKIVELAPSEMTGRPIFVNPPNKMPRIESIWCFLSVDGNGSEGVCAGPVGDLPLCPLIAADETRLEQLRGLARDIAELTDKKIVLDRFTGRVDMETIEP
jgi:hypothetical protein